jgi:hypothetical protein
VCLDSLESLTVAQLPKHVEYFIPNLENPVLNRNKTSPHKKHPNTKLPKQCASNPEIEHWLRQSLLVMHYHFWTLVELLESQSHGSWEKVEIRTHLFNGAAQAVLASYQYISLSEGLIVF